MRSNTILDGDQAIAMTIQAIDAVVGGWSLDDQPLCPSVLNPDAVKPPDVIGYVKMSFGRVERQALR